MSSLSGHASLSEVAGRRLNLMGGAGVPLFAIGAVLLDEPGRWVIAAG